LKKRDGGASRSLVHAYHFCPRALAQKLSVRDSIKAAIAVTYLIVIGGGGMFVLAWEWQRKQDQQQLELVRTTDLPALYRQINFDRFEGKLPADVRVTWDELGGNDSGGYYVGETSFDDAKPAIRIDIVRVKTEEHLLHVMQHEMCHVATHDDVRKTGQDPHGDFWHACMRRFH
jgi:hypothetical protein